MTSSEIFKFVILLPLALALTKRDSDVSSIRFGRLSTVYIVEDQLFKVSLEALISNSDYPSLISIYSKLIEDDNNSTVNIVAVSRSYSESWKLSNGGERNITFCVDQKVDLDHINIIVQVNNYVQDQNNPPLQMEFLINSHEAELSIPHDLFKFNVTDEMSTTILVKSARPNSTRGESFVFNFEDIGDELENACAVVTVQPRGCPLKNHRGNFEASELYATMLKNLRLTIRTKDYRTSMNKFSEPFFVNIFLHPNPSYCERDLGIGDPDEPKPSMNRLKQLSVSIRSGLPYISYIAPISVATAFVIILIIVSCVIIWTKNYDDDQNIDGQSGDNNLPGVSIPCNDENEEQNTGDYNMVSFSKTQNSNEDSVRFSKDQQRDETDGNSETNKFIKKCKERVRSRNYTRRNRRSEFFDRNNLLGGDVTDNPEKSELTQNVARSESEDGRLKRVDIGLKRLLENATLENMSSILRDDPWFRRNRSRVYCYLIPLIGMFYFIPAIQFAFLAKNNEAKTGSLDLCFHNFGCAHPFSVFSDFNHIVSNMSYVAFGVAFIFLVKIKARKLSSANYSKKNQIEGKGIMQQLSIFYAMGFAIILQAMFSICYHVCPTNLSLQFDTTMMYVICVLCYIKIYQFRHPDATPNAYSVVFMIGILVLLEALTLHSPSWIVFGLFILFYVVVTVFIAFDCYYIGIGRLDWAIAKELAMEILCSSGSLREWFSFKYPYRFIFYLIFCLLNFANAGYAILQKHKKPNKSVSHVALGILAGNLILYLSYYLIRKSFLSRRPGSNKRECAKCTHKKRIGRFTICLPFTSGSFFGILALVFGGFGLHFYWMRNANRNLSPSESRNLNSECSFMGFYDNHDMWHFFGSAGIFMAFLALLTVDDDLLNVSRKDIEVF